MRGLAAAARFQRIVCRFQHILRRGAAHDQKPRRIDPEGMEPRRIKPAIFAGSLFLLDPDDGAPILCGALCRAGGKGERKAGRRHMRARIFGKDLVQRIARQTMRKGGIGPGKAKRETAGARKTAPVLASCPAGKTALRIIACNGRNHAPQRRDVDAAHVRFLSNCSLFVLVLNRARQESSGIRRRDPSAGSVGGISREHVWIRKILPWSALRSLGRIEVALRGKHLSSWAISLAPQLQIRRAVAKE